MIALLLALLAQAGAGAALAEASPLALDVQVTPEEVTLGEHVQVRIAIDHDARDVYALPAFDPAPLAIPQGAPPTRVRREEIERHARTTFELTLTDYATLEPRLPDLTFRVTGPQGERVLNVRGRPLKFRSLVKEENAPSAAAGHHGPKPPVAVLVRSLLWLGLLLGLAAAAAAFLIARRLRRRKALASEPAAPPIEPDEAALNHLAALKAEAPWKRGQGRPAIFRLSEIVRAYLGARLQFNALDLTSEEFLAELRRRRLLGLDLAELEVEVRWEELVKFAKVEPSAEECLRGIERAELMVRHTRVVRAVPAQGAAA